MAELGGVASVVGIATAALQSVQFLHSTVNNIKGVPDAISGIKTDLQSIAPILSNLDTVCKTDDTQIALKPEIKAAVSNCEKSCTEFTATIEHWMRHSTVDKAFWVNRWRVALFRQEKIAAFKGQLNGYKSTLNMALSTATMYVPLSLLLHGDSN
jgi:small nuclear ribonucleoprotein (snRNP)-like protein